MSARSQWLLVALACALFLLQAVPLLCARWVEDESWSCTRAYSLLTEGRNRNPAFPLNIEGQVSAYPPAHALILVPVFKLFGVGPVQARAVSVAAGITVVVLTFLLGRQLAGQTVGLVAAVLVATDNILIFSARTVRPDVFVAVCTLLAVLLYFLSRERNSVFLAGASGLAVGLGLNFHPNAVPVGAAVGLFLLAESPLRFWRQPRTWAFAICVILAVLPYYWWGHSTPIHIQAFGLLYSGGKTHVTFAQNLRAEFFLRYAKFVQWPYRAHILLLALASLLVLGRKRRVLLVKIGVIVGLQLLFFLNASNKEVRYFVIVIPFFAIAMAAAATARGEQSLSARLGWAACVLYGLSQIAGNVMFLRSSRPANYAQVSHELQQIIPPGESVYGAITFWMALHDHPYYAYERTPFDAATEKLHPLYLILNDRVMVGGQGRGADDWASLRQQANDFAHKHGHLIGHVAGSFYGDLEVYQLEWHSP